MSVNKSVNHNLQMCLISRKAMDSKGIGDLLGYAISSCCGQPTIPYPYFNIEEKKYPKLNTLDHIEELRGK